MRAMVLLDSHQEREADLENKKREVLEKQEIAGRQLTDILLRNDLLEKKIEEQFKEKLALEEAHQVLSKKIEKLETIATEKTARKANGQAKLVSWNEPNQRVKLVFGAVFIHAVLTLKDEEEFESFFIRLGKRSIPCETESFYDKNDGRLVKIEVSCSFTVGNGIKLADYTGS